MKFTVIIWARESRIERSISVSVTSLLPAAYSLDSLSKAVYCYFHNERSCDKSISGRRSQNAK